MNIRIASAVLLLAACAQTPPGGSELPAFRADPNWPRPLAEENGVQLVLGQVTSEVGFGRRVQKFARSGGAF